MIYLLAFYFIFLLAWFGLSYLVARQLRTYGFVGDATRHATRIYFIVCSLIILFCIFMIMIA